MSTSICVFFLLQPTIVVTWPVTIASGVSGLWAAVSEWEEHDASWKSMRSISNNKAGVLDYNSSVTTKKQKRRTWIVSYRDRHWTFNRLSAPPLKSSKNTWLLTTKKWPTLDLMMQCSTSWAVKPTRSLSLLWVCNKPEKDGTMLKRLNDTNRSILVS